MTGARTVDRTEAAFADRVRAVRRSRWRRRAAWVLVPVLLVGLAAFVLAGPVLRVRHVEVVGVRGAQATQVQQRAAAVTGTPMVLVRGGSVAAQVQQLPFVASVRVRRGWPSTLRVLVTARQAVAAVPAPGAGYQLVDATGVVFGTVPVAPRGVPVVRAAVGAGPATLKAAVDVLAALPSDLRRRAGAVTAASPDAVTFTLGAARVAFGGPEDAALKVETLRALLRTPARMYDVSAPSSPVTR